MAAFFQPAWLLLLIPLAVAWFAWPLPGRGLRVARALTFLLVILALARFAIRLPDRAGSVIVVADRSESMPKSAAASEKEIIDLLHKSMGSRDLLGVVSFGSAAAVEQPPQHGEFAGFTAQIGADHSDLNHALNVALSLIPPDASGRILVLSDGKWTGEDPVSGGARAAGRGIAIDYRAIARPQASDLAIQSFLCPQSVLPDEAYVLSAWIRSPADQQIQYQLERDSTVIASGAREVSAGLTRLMFRDRAGSSGLSEYRLLVKSSQEDPVPENNQARALVSIQGARPVIVLSEAGERAGLVQLLQAGGVEVRGRAPGQCRWTLEELSQCAAVLVENVPAGEIGRSGMETLASWVEETGSGLMLTGGQKSYGPGGYFKSPLDRILPVSMEMRREHRKLSLAIVVALDRSGSMAISAGGGRTKMDLADLGTVQVLDLLSPMDELGVIAVDTSPHIIVPLDSVDRNQGMRGRILSIDSMGGGIYIYEALSAAARMITQARAQTRHIILFADANDSEQPGRYRELVEKCRESGVTVSVVGLGTPADQDADLLKDIATLGGGTCYFTDSAQEIPRLFAQDTFTVARSTFVDEATPFQFTAGFDLLGAALGPPPPLGGYNLCYLRPDANLAAVTTDEYQAPVVSAWSAGAGRVLCFAGEADGKYTGPLAGWSQAGEFFSTLARWTAGRPGELPSGELLTEQVRDGNCLVQLHLDPDRTGDPFPAVPHVRVLHGLPGVPPEKQSLPLQWKSADLLEVSLPISGRETVLNTVEIPGLKPVTLPPVCLPYSPEFAPDQPGRGVAALARLASVSGGKERIEIPQTWAELPVKRRYVELAPWLLVLAVILFLGEILERRTGWLSRVFARPARLAAEEDESVAGPAPARRQPWSRFIPKRAVRKKVVIRPAAITEAKPASEVSSVIPASKPAEGESAASNLEALREARERASRRTSRP